MNGSGLKRARIVWTIVFLGVTLVAIVMEVTAGVFHVTGTIPWTEYLAQYVPWPFQLAAYVILAVWLPFHFWRHDHMRKIAYNEGADAMRRRTHNSLEGFATGALQRELVRRGYYMASLLEVPLPRLPTCACLGAHHCGR